MSLQVLCTENHATDSDRITHIGGKNNDGTRWKVSEKDAINGMRDSRRWSFFVEVGGRRANVVIGQRNGVEYLKTDADGYTGNNLRSLPSCPV